MTEQPPGAKNTTCKLIAAFVAMSSHLIMHQIDVTSVHFSVAFNIPIHNISIYFGKLFSFRCMLIAAGTASELVVSELSKIIEPGRNKRIRKWFSMGSFIAVFFLRMLCLFFLSRSSQLGYYVYVILSIEAYFFGYFHASVVGLVPEHSLAVAFAVNVSRFFILSMQLILDALFYSRALTMIKLQFWIGVFMTGVGVGLWIYFNTGLCAIISAEVIKLIEECVKSRSNEDLVKLKEGIRESNHVMEWLINIVNRIENMSKYTEECQKQITNQLTAELVVEEKGFGETLLNALSPFLMFFGGSMFKDFLFPGVLPYALLRREKCHVINMLVPVSSMSGPVLLFALEIVEAFPNWTHAFNAFWLFIIPMIIIFLSSFLAMHSKIRKFRLIINAQNYVIHLTLILVFCNGFLDPLSFAGVAKIVKRGFEEKIHLRNEENSGSGSENTNGEGGKQIIRYEGRNSLLTVHMLSALFMRFVFAKISVGYNDTRVSLGYCLPKFRPNHRMSKFNTGWYIFRQTFIRAWKDTGSDFKLDVKKYL